MRRTGMLLHNRRLLARLMSDKGYSARRVAVAAGWRSHSYMNRLLSGEVVGLETERAEKIARFLGVDLEELFSPRVSSVAAHNDDQRVTA